MKVIRDYRKSSSFSVGFVFTTLLSIGIIFISYFLYLSSNDSFIRESKAAIIAKKEHIQTLNDLNKTLSIEAIINEAINNPDNEFIYLLRDADGRVITGQLEQWPTLFTTEYSDQFYVFEIEHALLQLDSKSSRIFTDHYDLLAITYRLNNGQELLISRNIDDLEVAQWLAQSFGWAMIIILSLISILTFAVAYYVVSRINRIANTTDAIIQTGELSRRLSIDSSWDDLSKLSVALNHLLDELEKMVLSIKSVSDNIAHDLRTPITRLRAKIETEIHEEQKEELLSEVDNLLGIFNSLLRIADIESKRKTEAFALNNLIPIVEDVIDLYGPLMEEKQIKPLINLGDNSVTVLSDQHLLFQAMANILDNAVKFTPENGTIKIIISSDNTLCNISICDSGPGIPEDEIEHVTDRFYRVDSSRTKPGNGLGMALVKAVVDLHKGELKIENSANRGLCCSIIIPLK